MKFMSNCTGVKGVPEYEELSNNVVFFVAFSPVFINSPQSAAVKFLSEVTLTCSAHAQPPPTYMWFRLDSSGESILKGENREILQFDALSPDDRGIYSCSVANELGTINSEDAILSIEGSIPYYSFA